MSTPVTQYYQPDPSLAIYANFGQFIQYLITGTNYILDAKAQVVYEFNPAVPGVLTLSNGSYVQFLAYLTANPVTLFTPNPVVPNSAAFGFPYTPPQQPAAPLPVTDTRLYDLLELILLELRCTRMATVSLATQGGLAQEQDFDPSMAGSSPGPDGFGSVPLA